MSPAQRPELWYPKASVVAPPLPTLGLYRKGYPEGAVVHFTAGSYGLAEIDLARHMGYTYLVIDKDGVVHQGFPLDHWGSHAGRSTWPSLGDGVSRWLVGIEIECAGSLKAVGPGEFRTWFGSPIDAADVRIVPQKRENQAPGAYHRYTEAQEKALVELLLWLHANNPAVFSLDLVVGHDEVSPGRKTDPGGSLSMTMPALREYLKKLAGAPSPSPASSSSSGTAA